MAKNIGSMMKAMGRNMARAKNQGGGYAKGGGVKMPAAKDMGTMSGSGMDQSGFGAGKARGGKSTRGNKFSGSF